MNQITRPQWMMLSECVYRALLRLYPADYRREYGELMLQIFRDVLRDRYRRCGIAGVALWWWAALLDLTLTVIEQWRKVKFTMSRSTLIQLMIQLTGILLVIGGICGAIAAFSQLQPGSHYSYYGVYQLAMYLLLPAYTLIGVGNWGLALQYGKRAGTIGWWALMVSGVGALVMMAGFWLTTMQDRFWTVAMMGIYLHTGGMVVFGLLNLRARILPVFRGLPLITGVILLAMIYGVFYTDRPGAQWGSFTAIMGMSVIWMVIGVAAHRDQTQPVKAKMQPVAES